MKSPVTFGIASIALAAGGLAARPEPPSDAPHATLRLIAADNAMVPGGTTELAFLLEIEQGWHTYWRGYSDTGMPPTFKLVAPPGYRVGTPVWPAPMRHVTESLDALDHTYETRLTVVVPVHAPATATIGERAVFQASATWLVCKEVCVPEDGTAKFDLPIAARNEPSPDRPLFDAAKTRWSKPIGWAGPRVVAKVSPGELRVDAPKATKLTFYPDLGCAETPELLKEGEREGGPLVVTLGAGETVVGVVEAVFDPKKPHEFYEIRVPIASVGVPTKGDAKPE